MSSCRHIQHLLHLYREGELTKEERSTVNQHVDSCAQCAAILKGLSNMDNALMPLRTETAESGEAQILVQSIIRHLSGKAHPIADGAQEAVFDTFIRWARPAFTTLVLPAVCILVFQQVRDAVKVSDLEERLQKRGTVGSPSFFTEDANNFQSLNDQAIEKETRDIFAKPLRSGAIDEKAFEGVRSVLLRMLGRDYGIFTRLAQLYPNLARINPDDGLEEWERKILSTEGKAFLKDFERLIKEGDK